MYGAAPPLRGRWHCFAMRGCLQSALKFRFCPSRRRSGCCYGNQTRLIAPSERRARGIRPNLGAFPKHPRTAQQCPPPRSGGGCAAPVSPRGRSQTTRKKRGEISLPSFRLLLLRRQTQPLLVLFWAPEKYALVRPPFSVTPVSLRPFHPWTGRPKTLPWISAALRAASA